MKPDVFPKMENKQASTTNIFLIKPQNSHFSYLYLKQLTFYLISFYLSFLSQQIQQQGAWILQLSQVSLQHHVFYGL